MQNESPINPIPPVVMILTGIVVLVEAVLSLASAGMVGGVEGIGWRISAFEAFGFSPAVWELVIERGQFSADYLRRFATYAFVHVTLNQAIFGGAMLLALGKFVGDLYHWAAVLAVFFAATVFGAFAFGALAPGNPPLLGVYPAVYGLIGAFTYITWLRLGDLGQNQLTAFRLVGFLMALQLVFGLMFGGGYTWIADIAGFIAGLSIAPMVAPGGWAAFVQKMRNR